MLVCSQRGPFPILHWEGSGRKETQRPETALLQEGGQVVNRVWSDGSVNSLENSGRIQDFPDGGAPTSKVGVKTYYLANFSQKLHENERIRTQRGGRASLAPPLDPPMRITK